jgi:hypothetical protein
MTPSSEELSRELQQALQRAGLDLPPGRLPGLLATYTELRAMLPLLRRPRSAAAEPAGVYDLATVTREQTA